MMARDGAATLMLGLMAATLFSMLAAGKHR